MNLQDILFLSAGGTPEKGWDRNADSNGYAEESRVFNYLETRLGIQQFVYITVCQRESTDITSDIMAKICTYIYESPATSIVLIYGENAFPKFAEYIDYCGFREKIKDKRLVGVSATIPVAVEGSDVLLLLGYAAALARTSLPGIYFCKQPFVHTEIVKW